VYARVLLGLCRLVGGLQCAWCGVMLLLMLLVLVLVLVWAL
jgi:hypothetical protein